MSQHRKERMMWAGDEMCPPGCGKGNECAAPGCDDDHDAEVTVEADDTHECVFVEEQEPSGRLILPPCIVCGLTAMDALEQLRGYDKRQRFPYEPPTEDE